MCPPATAAPSDPAPDSVPAKARSRFPVWLKLVLFGALMLLVYYPALRAGFIWDDDDYVTVNPTLRSLGGLGQIWGSLTATPQYYPLVHTSFWIEYHLWGLHPLGYHVDNVLLHALAAVLLWRVLVRLQLPGAWLAAGIFALHPVMVESVAWVTERKNVLAAVFYFGAALAWLRWPGSAGANPDRAAPRRYFLALILFAAALFSKTVTASLPAALLLIAYWQRGRITGRDVGPLLPFFALGLALGLVTSWVERTHVGAAGPEWAFSFSDRCLIAGHAVWFYAGKLIWPVDLTFIYPRWPINSAVGCQWLFPAAALAALGLLWGLRHRLGRGPLVAVLFFGGTLFPALGFTNVYPMRFSFVADHFQYLASVGLIVPASSWLWTRLRPIPLAAALLPLGLAVLTWQQTHSYADLETVWQDTLAKNPGCWLAQYNLGLINQANGQSDEARHRFQAAIILKPDYAEAQSSLGAALNDQGRTDDAIYHLQAALRLQPNFAEAHNNLGNAYLKQGRFADAADQFQAALRAKPDLAEAHGNLGIALFSLGRFDPAIAEFSLALRLQPGSADACNNLGYALCQQGRFAEGIRLFQAALQLNPDHAGARNNLARALALQHAPAGH